MREKAKPAARKRLDRELKVIGFRLMQAFGVERTPDQIFDFVTEAYSAPSALIRLAASSSERSGPAIDEIGRDMAAEGIDEDVADELGEDA